ncbi:hypothetical protein DUNSADRAFT_10099 [Dunaliella salina]|uniref:Encoded protein n=1 Tax=Dunaliella salina TaxID=3046 RepID=A0ABQ7H4Z2_DUNSA|nr:hypothetical protein DUNSADRAFT_10099 [Dunaliella salina]|eukprot:KAF5841928.1 hypothetical protein DUNSADRAFT_10099 [Dunaliella salina]
MSSDVFDNDFVLRPPMLLPKMLEAATMRTPQKCWLDGCASSFDNSFRKDSCSFRSTTSSASSPSAARSSLPQSPPCKALRFSTTRSDATLTAASKSMDAWVHGRQRPHPQQQPRSPLGWASPSPSFATAAGSGAASPSASSWVTAASSGPGSPVLRAKEGGSPIVLGREAGSPMVLAQEEYEDMVLMGTDDEGEGECLRVGSGNQLASEERALPSGRSAGQGQELGLWEDRSGEPVGVPVHAVVLPLADGGAGTDGKAGKGNVKQAEGFEVCRGTRRMQKVCSTVSERREEEELAEETETDMSGQEEGEHHHQHRRFLSGQSCSTGYSSADGGTDSMPEAHRYTNGHGNAMSKVAHIDTSVTRNPSSACSDPTKVPIPSQLSTFPPGTESCPSGVSASPAHSHEGSLCPLSPERLASLPTSQPTSATASAATTITADAASAAAADAAAFASALAADAVKQCSTYAPEPLPAAVFASREEEGGSGKQQQQQQGHGAGAATDASVLVNVCRVCRWAAMCA